MSSRPVLLISGAQLALAQLTNSALFDEEGNLDASGIKNRAEKPRNTLNTRKKEFSCI